MLVDYHSTSSRSFGTAGDESAEGREGQVKATTSSPFLDVVIMQWVICQPSFFLKTVKVQ